MNEQKLRILYKLVLPGDKSIEFPIIIDKYSRALTSETEIMPRGWAALDYQRCTDTTMQRTLSSVLGLVLATSLCPHAEYLKPLARFHLALADETIYRAVSMHLLAQYFRYKDGLEFSAGIRSPDGYFLYLQIINQASVKCPINAVTEDTEDHAERYDSAIFTVADYDLIHS